MDRVDRLGQRLTDALNGLVAILDDAGLRYALVGASALLLLGVELPRTTRDLDLAVVVSGGLNRIRSLFETHGLRSTSIVHRFSTQTGTEIDILPLPAEEHPRTIYFSSGERISAIGLYDAIYSAITLPLGESMIRVAPLAVLIAIKLHTATVRRGGQDLEDALVGMQSYESAGIRRFDLDYAVLSSLSWETAGAYLAGKDARELVSPSTRHAIVDAISHLLGDVRTTDRYARGPERRLFLEVFLRGLENRRYN